MLQLLDYGRSVFLGNAFQAPLISGAASSLPRTRVPTKPQVVMEMSLKNDIIANKVRSGTDDASSKLQACFDKIQV